ncbi:hypothetical protein LT40_07055 [Pseudomonas rhizosphaerae]|uniref:Uncharacterized protein n=1 Tax=Pseudomonas rhizosphaerae TaxID=216142 RepID=A0A089YNL3_9PSED|nr:DUF6555 family protein [Pseudomonas rhizosphaerae]AIS17179.1 hypothetical protein LT40_07055 [Pseudomonas rhizosphaerae]
MKNHLYIIDYIIHGQPRSFVVRADKMDTVAAWHWASCDAGFGYIPKSSRDKTRKTSRPEAERLGISEMKWRSAEPSVA